MIRPTVAKDYQLHIPEEIERRLRRCRTSIRLSIRARLQKIVRVEAARPSLRRSRTAPLQPPLRFYSSESYRVSYHIDRLRREVVVLGLRKEVDE